MGLYDTVIANCPVCGQPSEFQSKSGDCMLRLYSLKDCPDDVLVNVNRHSPSLCDCGTSFEVDIDKRITIEL